MSFFKNIWKTGKPVCSVEFFPPKNEDSEKQFLQTAEELGAYRPDFVSMTYGAGGSSRERSIGYGRRLREEFSYEVLPHLTCVGHSRDEIRSILDDFEDSGFEGIMALRGDPPKGADAFEPHPDGLRYATDLVELIRQSHPRFTLGVAGYPETHPEAGSAESDRAGCPGRAVRSAVGRCEGRFCEHAVREVRLEAGTQKTYTALTGRPGADFKSLVEHLGSLDLPNLHLVARFVRGDVDNSTDNEVRAWVRYAAAARPKAVELSTLARARKAEGLKPITKTRMNELVELVSEKLGITPEVLDPE